LYGTRIDRRPDRDVRLDSPLSVSKVGFYLLYECRTKTPRGASLLSLLLLFSLACGSGVTREDRTKVGHDLGLALVLSNRLSSAANDWGYEADFPTEGERQGRGENRADQDLCASFAHVVDGFGQAEKADLPDQIPESKWSAVIPGERSDDGKCTFTISLVTPGWDGKSARRRFKVSGFLVSDAGQMPVFEEFVFGGEREMGEGLTELVPMFSLKRSSGESHKWLLKILEDSPAVYPAGEKTITLIGLGENWEGIEFPAGMIEEDRLSQTPVILEPSQGEPTVGSLWADCVPGPWMSVWEFVNPFDSIRTAGFVIVMCLIAGHVLLAGIFSWRHVYFVTSSIRRDFPSKIKDKVLLEAADRVFSRLKSDNEALSMRWREFRECVLEDENPPLNTEDAGRFIEDEHFALESRLWPSDSYNQSVPGILTSLGILGTFVGLVAGLSDFSVETADQVQVSIGVLIGGLSTAFKTSIWGVGLAILVTLVLRLQLAGREKRISAVLGVIDGAFQRLTQQSILQRSLDTTQGMAKDLEDAMTMGNDVRARMAKSTSEMEQTLKSLSGDLADALQTAIDQGFSQHLAAPFQNIMDQLGSTMSREQQGHSERITEIITSVDAMQHSSQRFLANLETVSTQQNVALDRVTQVMASAEGLPGALAPAVERLESTATKLEQLSGSLVQHQNAALEAGTAQADLAVSVEKQIRSFHEVAGSTLGELQSSLKDTAGVLGNIRAEFSEQTDTAQIAMRATATELQGSAEALQVAQANLERTGDKLHSAPEQIQSVLDQFSVAAENLGSIIRLTSQVADKFTSTLPDFSKASSDLVQSSSNVLQSTKDLSGSVEGTRASVVQLQQGMGSLAESNAEIREFWDEASVGLKEVAGEIERVQRGLVEWLGRYSNQWERHMGTTLDQLDEHLGKAVTSLGRQVRETGDIVEELQDWAENMAGRRE